MTCLIILECGLCVINIHSFVIRRVFFAFLSVIIVNSICVLTLAGVHILAEKDCIVFFVLPYNFIIIKADVMRLSGAVFYWCMDILKYPWISFWMHVSCTNLTLKASLVKTTCA